MTRPRVSVTIVTWNSGRHIGKCLQAVLDQSVKPFEVVVVDNASNDSTLAVLAAFGDRIRVYRNSSNLGFAVGQNQAIERTTGEWVLTLNPDVLLEPGFIEAALEAARVHPRIGTVCGKLRSIHSDFSLPAKPVLDSTGIYFTPAQRHFDRGWREPDDGRYVQPEYVFGACAAAAFFRREMIEDVSLADGFFDPDFFSYREDADVAWRAQLLGWRCLYTPAASGYHVRRVTPENRHQVPSFINMHSVKNRFLMRIKNMGAPLFWRHAGSILGRDLMVLGGCVLREPRSLAAFWHVARLLPRALAKRHDIMRRRQVSDTELLGWFGDSPVSRPVKAAVEFSVPASVSAA
ncbi:MAG: glycosyltransferase family 2 protein [Bryobacteraceae bacterium]